MRYQFLLALLALPVGAQPPVCTGIARDVDARCGCVKDPNSKLCEMVKAGFYEPTDFSKMKSSALSMTGTGMIGAPGKSQTLYGAQPAKKTAVAARPRQARVVPLAHKDYLRFLHPNAQLAVGFDFGKAFQSPELVAALFDKPEGEDGQNKMAGALREMDHLWLSFVAPNDVVILMTGKFEQGVAAGMFYAQGVQPVFLGDAHAMMIGSETSLQVALDRLSKPPAAGGWITKRARQLSKDHETWIVTEPPVGTSQASTTLPAVRQFALGFRLSGEAGIDGEVVLDSEAGSERMAAWIEGMKGVIREKTAVGALDSLVLQRDGASVSFAAKGDSFLAGAPGKAAMNSDFGVEVYRLIMAGFPGMPGRTVAQDRLLAVKAGMQRDEILSLLGPPLSVSSIQGLETPRETWTYQIPFGRQLSVRLDGGVVAGPAR